VICCLLRVFVFVKVMCVVDTEYLLNRAEPTLESLSTLAQSCDRFTHDDNGKGIH